MSVKIDQDLHRFTNLIEVIREVDTELSLQAAQILVLIGIAQAKAEKMEESDEKYDTYMTVFKAADILNLTPASASRNVAILRNKKRGLSSEALNLISNEEVTHPKMTVKKLLTLTSAGRKIMHDLCHVFHSEPYELATRLSKAGDKRKGYRWEKDESGETKRVAAVNEAELKRRALSENRKLKAEKAKDDQKMREMEERLARIEQGLEAKGSVGNVKVETDEETLVKKYGADSIKAAQEYFSKRKEKAKDGTPTYTTHNLENYTSPELSERLGLEAMTDEERQLFWKQAQGWILKTRRSKGKPLPKIKPYRGRSPDDVVHNEKAPEPKQMSDEDMEKLSKLYE